jgi:chemotaxis protein CheZ
MGHRDVLLDQESTGESAGAAAAAAEAAALVSFGRAIDVQVWGDPAQDSRGLFVEAATSADEAAGTVGRVAETASAEPAPTRTGEHNPNDDLYQRIGSLTRTLHDAMRELGYHDNLADARDNLPDARDRLAYIARLTGDAAEKVLNSVDQARSVQDRMSTHAQDLRNRWAAVAHYVAKGERATPAGTALIDETCSFLAGLGEQATATNAILTEIMMAQDFHDLTGQVIRKVVHLAQTLEEQLVKLLIEATPTEHRKKVEAGTLEGPVVNPETRSDVVTDQAGVDDLLASLGF